MNLTRPSEVTALLSKLGIRPSKKLGQNFLIDGNILRILLDAADLAPQDRVLEVGPGLGVVTEALADRVASVTSIEKDKKLAAYLRERVGERDNVTLIQDDALHVNLGELLAGGINKMVSNLPYSVGSRVLYDLAFEAHRPDTMVVTIQLEVAERILAKPSTKDYGILAVCLQMFYEASLVKRIPPGAFFPRPEVKSAIVRCERRPDPVVPLNDEVGFGKLVKRSFSQRRKKLINTLVGTTGQELDVIRGAFTALELDEKVRPENVTVQQWGELANRLG